MNVAKGLRQCMRALRHCCQLNGGATSAASAVNCQQRRGYKSKRPPMRHTWPARRGEDAGEQINQLYGMEKSFDPRYDERYYRSFNETSAKDAESRRRITQDTLDHQRRQERIIQDNRKRWLQRAEPKTNSSPQYSYEQPIVGQTTRRPSKREREQRNREAEEYSRRRRQQRQKEVKRQEREFRESRKGYKLPRAEAAAAATETKAEAETGTGTETVTQLKPSASDDGFTQLGSQAWQEKRAREEESQYWHTWSTCPEERQLRRQPRLAETDADAEAEAEAKAQAESEAEDDNAAGFKPSQRKGFVKPMLPYDSSVRRFQTHSSQLAVRCVEPPQDAAGVAASAAAGAGAGAVGRRRPSGMQKQYLLAREVNRLHLLKEQPTAASSRTMSLLQSHVFRAPKSAYADRANDVELDDIELPEQPRRSKLSWRGLPRPVYERFDSVNRAVARGRQTQTKTKATKGIRPPRLLPLDGSVLSRKPVPISSFSSMLAVNTHYTPHSEYTGYGRQTVCDAWQNFTNVHNLKPIY